MRALAWIHAATGRFVRETKGNVAIFLGFALVPLIGAVGLALDVGRAYLVEDRLTQALDAASLAAARVSFADDVDPEADARGFFEANYPAGFLSSEITDFSYDPDPAGEFFTVSAEVSVPTTLMRLFGQERLAVAHATEVQRLTQGLELSLVMDTTGSMSEFDKIGDMQSAARRLIDILYPDATEQANVWVSVVPYLAAVNIGTAQDNWLSQDPTTMSGFGDIGWNGCVEARTGLADGDEIDDPPGTEAAKFTPYLYPRARDNVYDPDNARSALQRRSLNERGTGPNLGCGPAITPLTNQPDVLRDAISEMVPLNVGGTASNLGMVWGWRTLSPDWQGYWPGLDRAWQGPDGAADMPLAYDQDLMTKAVILLTDGDNKFFDWPFRYHYTWWGRLYRNRDRYTGPDGSDYTAYGRLFDWQPSLRDHYDALDRAQQTLDDKLTRICDRMKSAGDLGIDVYTITFGQTPSRETQDLYESCASGPGQYFHAPDGDDLDTVFRTIGQRLSNLRVVR